ncbi:unnamed protein product [marine sediment metagenome]|uniref:Uncharacterized protein n=1 Tax=marine sediment metagenome TaxID=412755 RepID=X1V2Y5_9ZZZZ
MEEAQVKELEITAASFPARATFFPPLVLIYGYTCIRYTGFVQI